jgi:hypothetical protein
MEYEFICFDNDSTTYPSLTEFGNALGSIHAKLIINELVLNGKNIPYFLIQFHSKCDIYNDWSKRKRFTLSGDGWSYTVNKIETVLNL